MTKSRKSVVLYHAVDCHLCERARAVLAGLRTECEFSLTEVDITGDAELERRYRELIPLVEIDGVEAFRYFVHADAFRRRIGSQSGSFVNPL